MKKTFSQSFKSFFIEPQWVKVRGIFWFCIITTIIHIVWRLWATTLNFYPVPGLINSAQRFLVYHLFNESAFIISHILKLKISAIGNSIIMENNVGLIFSISASGLKQMIQFVLLILIFRGPWKQKAWFIPAGIIIVHLTNVFRILCLAIIALRWPEQIHYAHDNWMRILFYAVIFSLWIIWMEKISIIKAKT